MRIVQLDLCFFVWAYNNIRTRFTELSRVSSGVGANFLTVYVGRHNRLIFARTIKTLKPEKAQKVWAFRIEKVPTNCIIS